MSLNTNEWAGNLAEVYASLMRNPPTNLAKEHCIEPGVLTHMDDIRGLNIIDLGCGHGGFAAKLIGRGARVVALDNSADMIRIARREVANAFPHNSPDIQFGIADLTTPLPAKYTSEFDMAVSSMVLNNLTDSDAHAAMLNMRKVLRPGGIGYTVVVDTEGAGYLRNFKLGEGQSLSQYGTVSGHYKWSGLDPYGQEFTAETDFFVRPIDVYTDWLREMGMAYDIFTPRLTTQGRAILAGNPGKIQSMDEHPRFCVIVSEKAYE